MGDALAERLADITEVARTIGTLLQTDRSTLPAPGRRADEGCPTFTS